MLKDRGRYSGVIVLYLERCNVCGYRVVQRSPGRFKLLGGKPKQYLVICLAHGLTFSLSLS